MRIRKTEQDELATVMHLYEEARRFMAANGNPNQWGKKNPPQEVVEEDIRQGKSYVCLEDEKIVGTFYYAKELDPTYKVIEDGSWLNEEEYAVVHRITSKQGTKGVATFCLNWAYEQFSNLRIDTHQDNLPMQRLLKKNGFIRCGIIHIADGSERIAYQKK